MAHRPSSSHARRANWPSEADGSGFFPVVPLSCTKCGHIVSIQALWIFEPQELRLLMEAMEQEDQVWEP